MHQAFCLIFFGRKSKKGYIAFKEYADTIP